MKDINWKIIPLYIPAVLAEIIGVICNVKLLSTFANWVADREYGDPKGKWWQTRKAALRDIGIEEEDED